MKLTSNVLVLAQVVHLKTVGNVLITSLSVGRSNLLFFLIDAVITVIFLEIVSSLENCQKVLC